MAALILRDLILGVYIRARDFWKLPNMARAPLFHPLLLGAA